MAWIASVLLALAFGLIALTIQVGGNARTPSKAWFAVALDAGAIAALIAAVACAVSALS